MKRLIVRTSLLLALPNAAAYHRGWLNGMTGWDDEDRACILFHLPYVKYIQKKFSNEQVFYRAVRVAWAPPAGRGGERHAPLLGHRAARQCTRCSPIVEEQTPPHGTVEGVPVRQGVACLIPPPAAP